jgi:bifunctional UDP-N-acetylglucosamine pyrophosphorylase/glucosamine-1-phosphate N-acetyltransferase
VTNTTAATAGPLAQSPDQASPDGPNVAAIVLAAGHGTRLHSAIPKHLHEVAGVPIVKRVIQAGMGAQPSRLVCLVSPVMHDIDQRLGMPGAFEIVIQDPARGTGDAVRIGLDAIADDIDWVICLLGDSCLLTGATVKHLLQRAISEGSKVAVLTAKLDDPKAYGRIERDEFNRVIRIVEKKSDDVAKRIAGAEINSGIMVLDARWARQTLPKIAENPDSGEIELTQLVQIAVREHRPGNAWPVQTHIGDENVVIGVNDRHQLVEADDIVRRQVRKRLLDAGVTIIGADTVFIDEDVEIGQDTVIYPHSTIFGKVRLGEGCVIGPAAHLRNVTGGDRVTIVSSTVADTTLGSDIDIGPYAHLRGNTQVHDHVHIGNYAEMNRSDIGAHSKIGHFSYLGDTTVGEAVNIGAGVITANFDGTSKHPTHIGDGAFIGCDSVLVAPVDIGEQARTGAGSVVTHDVPASETVVGVPARLHVPASQAPGETM